MLQLGLQTLALTMSAPTAAPQPPPRWLLLMTDQEPTPMEDEGTGREGGKRPRSGGASPVLSRRRWGEPDVLLKELQEEPKQDVYTTRS